MEEKALNLILEKLDKMDTRLDKMDTRFDKMDTRFDKMDTRFEKLEQGQAKLEQGQAKLEQGQAKLETIMETKIDKNIKLLVEGYSYLAEKVEKLDTMAEDIEYIKIKIDLLDAATRLNSYDIKKLKIVK